MNAQRMPAALLLAALAATGGCIVYDDDPYGYTYVSEPAPVVHTTSYLYTSPPPAPPPGVYMHRDDRRRHDKRHDKHHSSKGRTVNGFHGVKQPQHLHIESPNVHNSKPKPQPKPQAAKPKSQPPKSKPSGPKPSSGSKGKKK